MKRLISVITVWLILGLGVWLLEAKEGVTTQIKTKKEGVSTKSSSENLPPIKKKPPFKVGDVVGYSEPGLPERYVGRVVVILSHCGNIGVDNEENIYILRATIDSNGDATGVNIWKYDKEGKLIFFKHNHGWVKGSLPSGIYVDLYTGEIYTYDSESIHKGFIKHYSSQGELIATYQAPKDVKLGCGIYVEDDVLYSRYDGREICKVKRSDEKKILSSQKEDRKEVNLIMEDYHGEGKWNREKDIVKFNLLPLKKRKILTNEKSPVKDEVILKLPDGCTMYFEQNVDKEGNIYLLCQTGWRDDIEYEMRKYDISGKLLAVIKMKDGFEINSWLSSVNSAVDSNGNIYDIFSIKEGIYVVKWSTGKK